VLDTGKTDHPDLAGAWFEGYDFVSQVVSVGAGGDGDGYDADPSEPVSSNFFTQSSTHGTFVAGIIAARADNGVGVAGIGWDVQVMPMRVLSAGYRPGTGQGGSVGGYDYDAAQAVRYAAGLPNASGTLPSRRANVINMSFGGPNLSPVLRDAINAAYAAGVVLVASSGNEATSAPRYPAAFDHVLSVGAVTMTKDLAYYSNTGSTVDFVAPGGDPYTDVDHDGFMDGIFSTIYYSWYPSFPVAPTYLFWTGTSFAAAQVSGVIALMLSVSPSLQPDQIEALLVDNAEDLGAGGRDDQFGNGLIDAYWSVESAMNEAVGDPVLAIEPTQLLIDAASQKSRDASIRNRGGGLLTISAVTVATDGVGGWLSASATGWGDRHKVASAIHVVADGLGLPSGLYRGTVTVESNGGTVPIHVTMSIGVAPSPPLNLPITVRALRADTGVVVQELLVNPAESLFWTFAALPIGVYRFEASSDIDNDRVFGEAGEVAGAFGADGSAQTATIYPNETTSGIDFTVTPQVLFGGGG
jgi:serine protease